MNPLSIGALGTASASADKASAKSGDRSDSNSASRFDALLNASPAAAPAKNTASSSATPAERQDSDASEDPALLLPPGGELLDSTAGKPADETLDDAQWPPLGLSGLIPVPLEPAPAAAAPLPTAAAASGNPVAAPLAGAIVPPGQTPPAPAAEAAVEVTQEQIALPVVAATAKREDSVDTPEPLAFQQLLQGMATTEARASAATPATPATVPGATPDLDSPDFDEAIGTRIGWMADQKISHAHIRITPHDMGQIDVKLQLEGDRLHATFTSAHAEVRSALENSLPRLREMLGEQGLELAQADVGQQQSRSERGEADSGNGSAGNAPGDAHDGLAPAMGTHTLRLRGLLDAYA